MAYDRPAEMAKMAESLRTKTGKSLGEWVEIARSSGLQKHGEIVKWLKDTQGLSHGYANMVTHTLQNSAAHLMGEDAILLEAQYAGAKASMRPIYDRLVEIVTGFGADVQLVPMKAYVSVRRSKQFAVLQPTTATRMDVGLKLKGLEATNRLEAGGFNGMVSNKVKVGSLEEVDAELIGWLRKAYEDN